MAKTIAFRCKTPSGPIQISSLTDEDRIIDLKTTLTNLTGINRLKVLHGYPPKELDLNRENVQLGKLFKTFKESLIVSENTSTSQVKETSSKPVNLQSNQIIKKKIAHQFNGFLNKSTGKLVRKVVPANNSCLFTAVYFCITNGEFNPNIATDLRKIIVSKVKDDPIQFNDAILGCPSEEYQKKIMREDVWGGSIELRILSDYYEIEIVAVDTQNVRVNRFGEDKNYNSMIFLIYDGIHYDSLFFEKSSKPDQPITIFSTNDDNSAELFAMALELASDAKAKGQFTDVKNFKLRCLACDSCFKGPEEANAHAKKTSHINFGEFSSA